MADYLPPVVARLTGDDSGLARTLVAAKDKVRRWAVEVGKTKATIRVDADLSRLDAKLQQAKSRDIVLKVKLDLVAGEVARVRRQAETPAAKLQVELRLATGQKEALRQQLQAMTAQVKVQPTLDPAAAAQIRAYLKELARPIKVPIKPVLDRDAYRRVVGYLETFEEGVIASIRPRVDDASASRTRLRMRILTEDQTVLIHPHVVGGNGGIASQLGGGGPGRSGILGTLLSLAPALVPVAASITASAASITAAVGASTVAVAAFGLAVIPQIKDLGAAADAQGKYAAAVVKYGGSSEKAADAQRVFTTTVEGMPAATQKAAGALATFKTRFKSWSDDLSGFTMEPVTHSFVVFEQLLPRLSPLVTGASQQLDRLMTVASGRMTTPGFDAFAQRLTDFANTSLRKGTDDLVHFERVLSEGQPSGAVAAFMRYAHEQGPAVRQTLRDISQALMQVLKGASEAGPGILTLVDAAAKLVAALPAEFIGRALQIYTALKLVGLTHRGITTASGAVTTLVGRLTALHAASVTAGGGVAGVRAALATLSTGAKVTLALALIGGLAYAAYKLSTSNRQARISIDDLSRSIEQGLSKGSISSPVIDKMRLAMKGLAKETDSSASNWDKIGYSFTHWGGKYSETASSTKAVANAQRDLGKALGQIAENKGVDTATQALALMNKEGIKVPTKYLKDYNSALADAAFESRMTANAQGKFGAQAQDVQKKLAAQQKVVDGLRESIQALDAVNQDAFNAQTRFAESISAVASALKDNGKTLDVATDKGRANRDVLAAIATNTDDYTAKLLKQNAAWDTVNNAYKEGHDNLVKGAMDFGLQRNEAEKLANSLLHVPKEVVVKGNIVDLQKKLADAKRKLDKAPKSQTAQIKGNITDLEKKVLAAKWQLAQITDKSITLTTFMKSVYTGPQLGGANATGSLVTNGVRRMAEGGMGRPAMMARGGSNVLWAEGGDESYIPHDRRPRSRAIAERTVSIMGGSVAWGGRSAGGMSPAASAAPLGVQVAKGLWAGMSGQAPWLSAHARRFALQTIPEPMAQALGINSPSKAAMALGRWVGHGLVQGLTGTTYSVKAATLRLSRSIVAVFRDDARMQLAEDQKQLKALAGQKGSKAAGERADLRADMRQQRKLLSSGIVRLVEADNAKLMKLAHERDAVAGKLRAAQKRLSDLQQAWRDERSSVSGSIMQGAGIITEAPSEARGVNAGDVITQLKQKAAADQQFAAELAQLRKKGLRADLIDQLASAGVEQGGATALALSAGSAAQIEEMNRLQSGLKKTADATGTTVADAMYGAGLKSAEGLVKGLKSQQGAIEKQMLAIARAMQDAIRKALGIRSPSTVMAVDGENTGRGFALGLDRSTKHVLIAAQGMAMAARQGATITGGARAGGATVIHHHYHYHADVTVQGSVVTEKKLTDVVRTAIYKDGLRNAATYPLPRR